MKRPYLARTKGELVIRRPDGTVLHTVANRQATTEALRAVGGPQDARVEQTWLPARADSSKPPRSAQGCGSQMILTLEAWRATRRRG